MFNSFEAKCIPGIHLLLSIFDNSHAKDRNPHVLDLSYQSGLYMDISPLIFPDPSNNAVNTVEIDSIGKNSNNCECENIILTSIQESNIISDYYDLVVVRQLLENKTFEDTLNTAFSAANEDGIVTMNLLDNYQIEDAIQIVRKFKFYPCSIINLFADYQTTLDNYEFVGKNKYSENKAVYDILGYTSLTFIKKKSDIYTCIYDCEKIKYDTTDYYYIAQIHVYIKISYSIYNQEKAVEIDRFVNSGRLIKYTQLNKYIDDIKSAYGYMQKIYFSDFFEVDLPRHSSLDELDTSKFFYLSPSILVHRQFGNEINNKETSSLSELQLRKAICEQISEGYNIVDKNLNTLFDEKVKILHNNG